MDGDGLSSGQVASLAALVSPTERGIASRVLARTAGGNMTLFAFDAGQGLEEHVSPFDAFVLVQDGALVLTIGGQRAHATPGTVVKMPAGIPHALEAQERTRMLLVMLREPKAQPGE